MRSCKGAVPALTLLFFFIGLLEASTASAAVAVTPVTPHSIDAANANSIAFAGTTDNTTPQVDSGFHRYALLEGYSVSAGPLAADMLLFDVTVTGVTVPTGQFLAIVAGVGEAPTTQVVPIAAAQTGIPVADATVPTQCGRAAPSGNVSCVFPETATLGAPNALFQGARIDAGTTVRVGIYVADICRKDFAGAGALTAQCSGGAPSGPNAGSLTARTLKITFYAVTATDPAGLRPDPTSATSSFVTAQIYGRALDIQGSAGDSSTIGNRCRGDVVANDFAVAPYFPGDGEISVITASFRALPQTGSMQTASALILAFNEGLAAAAGTVTSSNFTNHTVGRVAITGEPTVTGFTNSEPGGGAQHIYTIYFAYRDRAGMIADNFGCFTSNSVRTAQIFGFMKKNSCFVATGAFHAEPALGVALLQRFRDEVLNRSETGRRIRDWYYSWSPAAGLWLLENPELRLPVLRALLPLEILAWVLLHPLLAGGLGLASILVIAGAVYARTREDGKTA